MWSEDLIRSSWYFSISLRCSSSIWNYLPAHKTSYQKDFLVEALQPYGHGSSLITGPVNYISFTTIWAVAGETNPGDSCTRVKVPFDLISSGAFNKSGRGEFSPCCLQRFLWILANGTTGCLILFRLAHRKIWYSWLPRKSLAIQDLKSGI